MAWTKVEKLKPVDKKFAPVNSADAEELLGVCDHVPLPVELELAGVNFQSEELWEVEQDPAYTVTSPLAEMDGIIALDSSLANGRLEVIVLSDISDVDIVEDMFRDAKTGLLKSDACVKTYTMSLFEDEMRGNKIDVGVYGRDCE